MKKGTGKISIGRVYRGNGDSYMRIEIEDDRSKTSFLLLEMDIAAFANAITGLAAQECKFTLAADHVGALSVVKEMLVPIDPDNSGVRDKAKIKKWLEQFEVEGWRAREGDYGNHHRRVTKPVEGYKVVFFRWVEDTPEAKT